MLSMILLRNQSNHLPSILTKTPTTTTIFPPPSKTLLLLNPYSTKKNEKTNTNQHRKNTQTNMKQGPPLFTATDLANAISKLRSKLSPSTVTAAISKQRNPHIAYQLFKHTSSNNRFNPDADTFLVTVKKLGHHRLFTEFDTVASLALRRIPPSQHLYSTILYFYAKFGSVAKAINVYKLMLKSSDPAAFPTAATCNHLFAALLGRGAESCVPHHCVPALRTLFRQMRDSGVAPDILLLDRLIKAYTQSLDRNDELLYAL